MLDDFELAIAQNYSLDEIRYIQGATDGDFLQRMFDLKPPQEVRRFMTVFEECFTLAEVRSWTRIFTRLDESNRERMEN